MFSEKSKPYTPDRLLPRTKPGHPKPDSDKPHDHTNPHEHRIKQRPNGSFTRHGKNRPLDIYRR